MHRRATSNLKAGLVSDAIADAIPPTTLNLVGGLGATAHALIPLVANRSAVQEGPDGPGLSCTTNQ